MFPENFKRARQTGVEMYRRFEHDRVVTESFYAFRSKIEGAFSAIKRGLSHFVRCKRRRNDVLPPPLPPKPKNPDDAWRVLAAEHARRSVGRAVLNEILARALAYNIGITINLEHLYDDHVDFPELLRRACWALPVKHVLADKGYQGEPNVFCCDQLNVTPWIPPMVKQDCKPSLRGAVVILHIIPLKRGAGKLSIADASGHTQTFTYRVSQITVYSAIASRFASYLGCGGSGNDVWFATLSSAQQFEVLNSSGAVAATYPITQPDGNNAYGCALGSGGASGSRPAVIVLPKQQFRP